MSTPEKNNRIDYVEFPAPSTPALQAAKRFYTQAFGWQFTDWGEEYIDTKDSGVGLGINADASHRPPAALVVLYSSDLQASRAKVLAAGGAIKREIFPFPGGRRFEFIDPAGNQVAVWSDK